MNIYALKGHKVKCVTLSAGYDYHKEIAKKHLEVGKEYTVDNWHTDVWLLEFPNVKFNSVLFEDVVQQLREMDEQHPDYSRFH
jgi:hypothetical protein